MSDEIEHSLRGPSGAHRWRLCHGSINAEAQFPDKAGREAAEGTIFHEYAAMCLMFDLEPEDFPVGTVHKQEGYDITFDEDMQHYMHAGLDWVRDHIEPGDVVLIEKRVDISPWCGEGEFGTADVGIIKVAKRKIINFDWKYGKGVPVSPIQNDQMYLYNLGVWNDYAEALFEGVDPADIEVLFKIEQPRAPSGGGEWLTTMADCLHEGKAIREDALATMNPAAPRNPGPKQCMFCRASGHCAEEAEYNLAVCGQKFEDAEAAMELGTDPFLTKPEDMLPMARAFVLLNFKAFKKWHDRVREIVLHDLKSGKEVPLVKAVSGRPGKRDYLPEFADKAASILVDVLGEDKAFEKKLVSPAQAEKGIGKKRFAELLKPYVTQPPGKPIIVPLDDKREPIQDFASKFDDMDDEDEDDN